MSDIDDFGDQDVGQLEADDYLDGAHGEEGDQEDGDLLDEEEPLQRPVSAPAENNDRTAATIRMEFIDRHPVSGADIRVAANYYSDIDLTGPVSAVLERVAKEMGPSLSRAGAWTLVLPGKGGRTDTALDSSRTLESCGVENGTTLQYKQTTVTATVLVEGLVRYFSVQTAWTAGELHAVICRAFDIGDTASYGLKLENTSEWVEPSRTLKELGVPPARLVMEVRNVTRVAVAQPRGVEFRGETAFMVYEQWKNDLWDGVFPVGAAESPRILALEMQIHGGSYNPHMHTEEFVRTQQSLFLPRSAGKDTSTSAKALSLYRSFKEMDHNDACRRYVEVCQECRARAREDDADEADAQPEPEPSRREQPAPPATTAPRVPARRLMPTLATKARAGATGT